MSTLTDINDSGGNPTQITVQQYEQLAIQAVALAADFVAIYESISTTKTSVFAQNAKAPMAAASPTPCSITDAQITSTLTPQTWAQLGG